MENAQKIIGVVQVLAMLQDGKTREEIRVHYGITKGELVLLFKHEDLIGKKTIKPKVPGFTIVADETPAPAVASMQVVADEVKVEEVKAEETVEEVVEETKEEEVEEVVETEVAKAKWE